MKLVVVLHDTPLLSEWVLDDLIAYIEENDPADLMGFMFYENYAQVEFEFGNKKGEDLKTLALFLMMSFDGISANVF